MDSGQGEVRLLSSTEAPTPDRGYKKKPRRGGENRGATPESPSLPLGIEAQWCSTAPFFRHLSSDLYREARGSPVPESMLSIADF